MTPTISDTPVTQAPPAGGAPTVDPLTARYLAELPALLEKDYGKWIIYTDTGVRKIGKTQTELYRYCLDELKLKDEQFIIRYIEPDQGSDIDIFGRLQLTWTPSQFFAAAMIWVDEESTGHVSSSASRSAVSGTGIVPPTVSSMLSGNFDSISFSIAWSSTLLSA